MFNVVGFLVWKCFYRLFFADCLFMHMWCNKCGVSGDPESFLSYVTIGVGCWGLLIMHWVFLLHSPFFTYYVFVYMYIISYY